MTIITTFAAVPTQAQDDTVQVHPVQFSHPASATPMDRKVVARSPQGVARPCPPALFHAPAAPVDAEQRSGRDAEAMPAEPGHDRGRDRARRPRRSRR